MLISIMYHHVQSDKYSNDIDIFEKHLQYISENFTTLFPTKEKIPKNSVCLVFDDGYYDFYKYVFPLLKKYNLKALLAVVPSVILPKCHEPDNIRLGFKHDELFQNYKKGTFCTYEELLHMQQSGHVQIVSHSYSHKNLTEDNIDLDLELKDSKKILEKKLQTTVDSFVFPFGKYNQKVLKETKKHYTFAFRIGNGINQDFNGINGVIYRINGDSLTYADEIFTSKSILKFKLKSFTKKILGK